MVDSKALIVFAKLPQPGQVKTRLGAALGMEEAADIYHHMAHRTFKLAAAVKQTGTEIWIFPAPESPIDAVREWVDLDVHYCPQSGCDLGMRMMNAFQTVFQAGTSRALVIGTDVPDLTERIIDRAFASLRETDIVIGPGTDGGYYMMGMSSPTKAVFEGIPWSTPDVLGATLMQIGRLGLNHVLLEPLPDIDTIDEYLAWKQRTRQ